MGRGGNQKRRVASGSPNVRSAALHSAATALEEGIVQQNLPDGTVKFINSGGKLHNPFGPAKVDPDGTVYHYINGEIHRDGGPAIVDPDRAETWYRNGEIHREDGPARIYTNGTEEWRQNGKLHRVDGPAIIFPDGTEEWWQDGRLHREDGPAIIFPDGTEEWYKKGKKIRSRVKESYDGGPYDSFSTTSTYNAEGKLHSFNEEPSRSFSEAGGDWEDEYHEHGKLIRVENDGTEAEKAKKDEAEEESKRLFAATVRKRLEKALREKEEVQTSASSREDEKAEQVAANEKRRVSRFLRFLRRSKK